MPITSAASGSSTADAVPDNASVADTSAAMADSFADWSLSKLIASTPAWPLPFLPLPSLLFSRMPPSLLTPFSFRPFPWQPFAAAGSCLTNPAATCWLNPSVPCPWAAFSRLPSSHPASTPASTTGASVDFLHWPPLKSPLTPIDFSSVNASNSGISRADSESDKSFRCSQCQRNYPTLTAFNLHLRAHQQGCSCPVCGKHFSRHWLLQGHLRTHTGEKPFKCTKCPKAFADKSNMRAHLQTHSGQKPFCCPRCKKGFALKSYLSKHQESACVRC